MVRPLPLVKSKKRGVPKKPKYLNFISDFFYIKKINACLKITKRSHM